MYANLQTLDNGIDSRKVGQIMAWVRRDDASKREQNHSHFLRREIRPWLDVAKIVSRPILYQILAYIL